jgi:hypothetical protein
MRFCLSSVDFTVVLQPVLGLEDRLQRGNAEGGVSETSSGFDPIDDPIDKE